jgi:hypothetical protein
MDAIGQVEHLLEETARRCLRLSGTRSLTPDQHRQLTKWVFGCLNQRFTIRERVRKRGPGELSKVLTFVARACTVLLELDVPAPPDQEENDDAN